jgi:4-amino-4-deoxy-L-arabinose transferase-like glycosyltransferase
VLLVLLLALGFRAGVVLATTDTYVNQNDAIQFDQIASSIARGDGYGDTVAYLAEGPSAFRGPTYPLVLAAVYVVVGEHSWTAGRLVNAMIGTALVALIGLVAAMLLDRRVGFLALVLAAVHPTLVLFTSAIALDPLLALLILGSLAAALQHRRDPRGMGWPAVAGACLGLAFLTRESGAFAIPSLVGLLWVGREAARAGTPRWRPLLVTGGVAVALVIPWVVRNAVVLDTFVPGTTTGGYGLAGTYNETSRHHPEFPAIWLPPERDPDMFALIKSLGLPSTEVELDDALTDAAMEYLRENPEYVPQVMFWNTVRLYDLQGPRHALFYAPFVPYPLRLTRLAVYSSYVFYAFAALALVTRSLRGTPWAFWLYPVVATIAFSLISGTIRYRSTIEPFLVIAAAAAVAWVLDRVRTTALSPSSTAPAPA